MPTSPPRHVRVPAGIDPGRALLVGVGILVLAQAAFRAWALYGGWFFFDDFNLLDHALSEPLTIDSLMAPYNGHLMPGGRLLAEVVIASGGLDWPVAASLVLALQVGASAACWWMLVSLFGRSLGSVALLLVYLSSALVVPAVHWWTAALNAVPLQLAMFLAVGAGARYLRAGRLRWLLATVLAVAVGLFFWEKAVLILPLLGALAFGWYAEGGPLARLWTLLRTRWPAVVVGVLLGAGYAAAYLSLAEQVGGQAGKGGSGQLVQNAVGSTFATGVVGGPWRWADFPQPTVGVDPPVWATQTAWVLLAAIVVYAWLRRERTLRAWFLLGGYLATAVGLTVWGRGGAFGGAAGAAAEIPLRRAASRRHLRGPGLPATARSSWFKPSEGRTAADARGSARARRRSGAGRDGEWRGVVSRVRPDLAHHQPQPSPTSPTCARTSRPTARSTSPTPPSLRRSCPRSSPPRNRALHLRRPVGRRPDALP